LLLCPFICLTLHPSVHWSFNICFARGLTLILQEVSTTHFVGRLISFTRNAVNKIVILPYFGVSTPLSLFNAELYPEHTSDTKKGYQTKNFVDFKLQRWIYPNSTCVADIIFCLIVYLYRANIIKTVCSCICSRSMKIYYKPTTLCRNCLS